MRGTGSFGLALLALTAASAPAQAFRIPDPNASYPIPHQLETHYADSKPQPWSTTYGDEAARRLGMENGRWEAFSADSGGSRFNLKGGLDTRGAVLRLTW
jgi:hypothetical protein